MKSRMCLFHILTTLPGCDWINQNLGWGPGNPDRRVGEDPDTWAGPNVGPDPFFSGPPVINTISVECNTQTATGAAELRTYVEFGAWVVDPVLDIQATGTDDRRETFWFPVEANIEFANDGSRDVWEYFTDQSDVYDTDAGQMTFDCTELQDDNGLFTQAAFRIYASADDTAYDGECAIWGHGSRDVFEDDCECFEAFLVVPPADPCGLHIE